MPEGTKASDVVMLLQACHRQIDTLTAQLDLMTALLRKHAAVKCPSCDGMGIDMSEDEDRLCGTCAGSGSAYPDDVVAALSELPTPTAPTNGEGDAK